MLTVSQSDNTGYCPDGRIYILVITRDAAAVRAAFTEPWSNGQVEGQITKLKRVKRQMYGRAKIHLIQARLIGVA